MRPYFEVTGYRTLDLTEAKLQVLSNGDGTRRLVAMIPKKWERPDETQTVLCVNGEQRQMRFYTVTEWEEIEIAKI